MVKVITYGTYDLFHRGHLRLLQRAKALGEYLIVGVTSDDFDKSRGKINVKQSLMERVEAVRNTGLADEIIIEEYEGQKIDDIKRYNIDVFTVGSDWTGKFDYLNEYCKVVYLERTEGISSSEIRGKNNALSLGIVGNSNVINKFIAESEFVNGINVVGVFSDDIKNPQNIDNKGIELVDSYDSLLDKSDAVFVHTYPKNRYKYVKTALTKGKHVLCESPFALSKDECEELFSLAKNKGLVLMEAIKTAYSMAYSRLLLLLKTGKIGQIKSIDVTCTSLKNKDAENKYWNSMCTWGPTALLPIFQILGCNYTKKRIASCFLEGNSDFDTFTKVDFVYSNAVASLKVGNGVKSEGELIISGTKGNIYVPAPWWKMDYFEIRYENATDNQRFFYQLDGEGIRYEISAFKRSVEQGIADFYINKEVSIAISNLMSDFEKKIDMDIIC